MPKKLKKDKEHPKRRCRLGCFYYVTTHPPNTHRHGRAVTPPALGGDRSPNSTQSKSFGFNRVSDLSRVSGFNPRESVDLIKR